MLRAIWRSPEVGTQFKRQLLLGYRRDRWSTVFVRLVVWSSRSTACHYAHPNLRNADEPAVAIPDKAGVCGQLSPSWRAGVFMRLFPISSVLFWESCLRIALFVFMCPRSLSREHCSFHGLWYFDHHMAWIGASGECPDSWVEETWDLLLVPVREDPSNQNSILKRVPELVSMRCVWYLRAHRAVTP